MKLTVIYSKDFLKHSPEPYDHPEKPERLTIAYDTVSSLITSIEFVEPEKGDLNLFRESHSEEYINRIIRTIKEYDEVVFIDPDTYVSPGTLEALERLAGAIEYSVEFAKSGQGPILILPRPPGHHAGCNGRGLGAPTLGFCILNTATSITKLLGKESRPLMVDFDAHHGNGSQDILWSSPIPHIDIHQDSATIYPGTGFPEQTGAAKESKININIPPGSKDDIFVYSVDILKKILEYYNPDYVIVSAGFDGYYGDSGFVRLQLGDYSYYYIGKILSNYRERLIIVLEGGYSAGLKHGLKFFLIGLLEYLPDSKVAPPKTTGEYEWSLFRKRLRELAENVKLVDDLL